MSISALGKKCSERCTVCSGMNYATHRSHSSVLQDYLYVLCTLVCEKPPRSASLNEIVHPPLKHIVRWCRHFVSYVKHVTTSVTQHSVSAKSLKFGGYYVYHIPQQWKFPHFTQTVGSGVFCDSLIKQ